MARGYAVVALVMFILIVTIPFGIASARIALFCLWPFGHAGQAPGRWCRLVDRQRRLVRPGRVVAWHRPTSSPAFSCASPLSGSRSDSRTSSSSPSRSCRSAGTSWTSSRRVGLATAVRSPCRSMPTVRATDVGQGFPAAPSRKRRLEFCFARKGVYNGRARAQASLARGRWSGNGGGPLAGVRVCRSVRSVASTERVAGIGRGDRAETRTPGVRLTASTPTDSRTRSTWRRRGGCLRALLHTKQSCCQP
jgi:hypothetical protein